MNDAGFAISEGLSRLWSKLDGDPAELARRLERRRGTLIGRPPRAWCLAVRASDTRITGNGALTFDSEEKTRISRHEVALDAPLVRRLCAGVRIDPPGETLRDVARKLGVCARGLTVARLRGVFDVHYKRGLGGWWGK